MNKNILLIDDDVDFLEEMLEFLEDTNFNVQTAAKPNEALALFKQSPNISIIATDIMMPEMDGIELITKILEHKTEDRQLAILIVTGHAGLDHAIQALRLGAMDFIQKPVAPDLFMHALNRASETLSLKELARQYHQQLEIDVNEKTHKIRTLADELSQTNQQLIKQNQELAIAHQMKDEFLSMMSHEFRTPLNAVIGFSEIMYHQAEKKDQEWLGRISNAGYKLLNMIETILSLTDIQFGSLKLKKEMTDIKAMILNVTQLMNEKIMQHNIKLYYEIEDNLPLLKIDRRRIMQAFKNILDNAIRFSEPDSIIVIGLYIQNDHFYLYIKDSGVGMNDHESSIACEKFRQVDNSTTRKYQGIGMGLTIARLFIELHDGKLSIKSQAGKGTTVTMQMPAIKQ